MLVLIFRFQLGVFFEILVVFHFLYRFQCLLLLLLLVPKKIGQKKNTWPIDSENYKRQIEFQYRHPMAGPMSPSFCHQRFCEKQ